ncbi:MAG: chromosome segregation protein SMC [Cocleimonas sp.]|nr:chromosome segregation protein SMC [Cocleimonas sp.]
MRLSKIKLAGFKSFVDPTTIDLRSNLTSIVGPNGCGKSNTIDAVRWVMGESSAKHLRGASMDDVIFKGSSTRKPVGQAFVELVFDNADGSLGGEYAQFSEISTKRFITRDGQSKYFLNGSRCRRRDITDIFLGTGLGPRSYAIIEQGMISRLIDAKPEELRVYIEEAAGISKYKERRRETENRIRHTRDNLDRLTDLREEIETQLSRLQRQASAAERYKTFKASQRRLQAELIVLRLQGVNKKVAQYETVIGEYATQHQAELATQRSLEHQIEQDRLEHTTANDEVNRVQAAFYQIGADISRLEQSIQHQRELKEKQQRQSEQLVQELSSTQQQYDDDSLCLEETQAQLEELLPQQEELSEELAITEEAFFDAEQKLADWQEKWQQLQQALTEPMQQAQVEKARMEQIENQLKQSKQRLERAEKEQLLFDTRHHELSLATLEQRMENTEEESEQLREQLEQTQQKQQQQKQKSSELNHQIDHQRSQLQSLKGRLASLEALQQAGLGKGKQSKALQHWFTAHHLDNKPRLAENIVVEEGWETAVETVLGKKLEAIQVDDFVVLDEALKERPTGGAFTLYSDTVATNQAMTNAALIPHSPSSLLSKIKQPLQLQSVLSSIFIAEDMPQALQQQASLHLGESIITRDGTWVGANWLQVNGNDTLRDGVLARQKEIETVQANIEGFIDSLSLCEAQLDASQAQQHHLEENKTAVQQQLNEQHRQQSDTRSAITTLESRIKQTQQNEKRIISDIKELTEGRKVEHEAHVQATTLRNAALKQAEILSIERDNLQDAQQEVQAAVNQHRMGTQQLRERSHTVQLQVGNLKTTANASHQQLERLFDRLEVLKQRELAFKQETEQQVQQEDLPALLQAQLRAHADIEAELTEVRSHLACIDQGIKEKEKQRTQAEQHVEHFRSLLEKFKMKWQEVSVQANALQQAFLETEFEEKDLLASLDDSASITTHQQQLDDIERKIARLGAINLAAIDEYKEQRERKVYLDEQNDDLQEALDLLESAIRKIDKDTRARFKDTFEQVNDRVQDMFPRLFGGGQARLEMTGDDLLTTGVSIMARPPGKRISSIQLMSGGEKALTAVAMVFAIFELNPAPFCMLDEVDAPLDEANVRRFAALVKHMSERVQFIFITHNKTTMELADNLIGVTMREPGVSRTVAVDVAEAARMANE